MFQDITRRHLPIVVHKLFERLDKYPPKYDAGFSGKGSGSGIDQGARGSWRLIRCSFIHLEIFNLPFVCAGSQKLVGSSGCFPRLSLWCHAHSWTSWSLVVANAREFKPRVLVVQSRFFVAGTGDRRGFTSMCSADFVAIAAPWTWWSSAHSDFVAGVVNRDVWARARFQIEQASSERCLFSMLVNP